MSQVGYDETNNNFNIAKTLLGGRKRSGTVVNTDMNLIHSPKSFDERYPVDIEKDLNLESLSNGDLSRGDNNSMQRSFTLLQN